MVSVYNTIETGHEDMIHNVELDYYGIRLATCSSDSSIKIFDVTNGTQAVADLKGHNGPVWQVAWSYPGFGNLLASCSFDRKVIIWREGPVWTKIYEYSGHESSVNSVAWAPYDYGCMLACGSSDGAVSILYYNSEDNWDVKKVQNAHILGCNAISWCPVSDPIVPFDTPSASAKRFVTGGCDNLVKIWKEEGGEWIEEQVLERHSDWVRDVAWAPAIDVPCSTIASCSQDGRVIIWTSEDYVSWNWTELNVFDNVVWKLSWSITGKLLAVSSGDDEVSLWRKDTEGKWLCVSALVDGEGSVNEAERSTPQM